MDNKKLIDIFMTSGWMCLLGNPVEFKKAIALSIANAVENDILKEENERLKSELEQSVKLPCKVGDMVKAKVVRLYSGNEIVIKGKITDINTAIRVEDHSGRHTDFLLSDIGETVFLLEEAEKALESEVMGNE